MGTMGFDVGIISKGSGSTNGKKSSGGIFISESTVCVYEEKAMGFFSFHKKLVLMVSKIVIFCMEITDDELMEHEDTSILETINLGADVRYESMEMSALVDRAVGRASLVNGQIQLMLHRKQESKVRVGVIALYFGFFSENRNLK
ncbi:hypothetical protein L2E82_36383 [Cichorium intybus]|uniref:Uncharacterized protein n=1 Tax=Cichorium intybus TaxID=13427 RepID=A0ACB9BRK0_CICIN|nr:hypothetical protein L2E82_36383 [Cichorium intybus]